MTTNTVSAKEAANRTRRAMALRDLLIEVGWNADKAAQLGDDGWDALARTIERRQGRPFRSPSAETRTQAIGLLAGELTIVPVAMPAARPAGVKTTPAAPATAATIAHGPSAGRPRVPVNVSLLVD